ncbi:MAG TPA: hypothetical protein VHD33_00365, partial [Legionellaceae bacterium]|nr:hypothetical protein [Legionellaceae bacterium]
MCRPFFAVIKKFLMGTLACLYGLNGHAQSAITVTGTIQQTVSIEAPSIKRQRLYPPRSSKKKISLLQIALDPKTQQMLNQELHANKEKGQSISLGHYPR